MDRSKSLRVEIPPLMMQGDDGKAFLFKGFRYTVTVNRTIADMSMQSLIVPQSISADISQFK